MRSQHIPMTAEEFDLLPRRPGWKHEYWDGHAHVAPSYSVVRMALALSPRVVDCPYPMRGVTIADSAELMDAFYEAFADTSEYCDWHPDEVRTSAAESVRSYFEGRRGRPHPASRVALAGEPGSPASIVGGVLAVQTSHGPEVDLLFVRPAWQRQGLATALASAVVNELVRSGETRLISTCHVANEPSVHWHRRFGFMDQPDLHLARCRLRCARHEIQRQRRLGTLTRAVAAELEMECARLEAEVRLLEARGPAAFDEVMPIGSGR